MLTIIHGDQLPASRQHLNQLLGAYKQKKFAVQTVTGKELQTGALIAVFEHQDLFAQPKVLVVEELHSLPISKKRTQLIDDLAAQTDLELIIWEKKKLTALQLKKLIGNRPTIDQKVELFVSKNELWSLLDQLSPQVATKKKLLAQYQAVLKQGEDPFYLSVMFLRQMRMLIQFKTNQPPKVAPFQIKSFQTQAQKFTLPQLLQAHHQLVIIDYELKSGQSALDLAARLALWIYEL